MSKRDIVKYTKALVRAGVMEQPRWMAALERTPPLPVGKPGKRPPKIEFPEDELIDAYYRKHPEARLEPIDLSSFEPPTARRFALRQLDLMDNKGMTRRAAFDAVEREFAAQRRQAEAAAGGGRQSVIDQIQAEEEWHLQSALRQYATSFGPETVRQHAKELWQLQHMRRPASFQGGPAAAGGRQGEQHRQGQGQGGGFRQPRAPQPAQARPQQHQQPQQAVAAPAAAAKS